MASTSLKQLVGFAGTARVRSTLNRLTRGRVGLYSTAEHYSDGPHAKVLRYYQYDSAKKLGCPGCGWVGDGDSADTNYFSELFDIRCPDCDLMLLIIGFPTFGEIEDAAGRGHPEAQRELELIRERGHRDTGS